MAVIPIIQQTWDTTSYVNPTRMNNIETNLGILSKATGIEYSTGVSVKDKIAEVEGEIPEIADNLTTDDSTKALSAKQGKVLNEKIEDVGSQIGTLKYVVLGNITASGEEAAWGKVFDSLSDGAYIVQFGFNGAHIGLCYRYGNGQHGMMFGMAYFSLAVYRLKVMSGTKSFAES